MLRSRRRFVVVFGFWSIPITMVSSVTAKVTGTRWGRKSAPAVARWATRAVCIRSRCPPCQLRPIGVGLPPELGDGAVLVDGAVPPRVGRRLRLLVVTNHAGVVRGGRGRRHEVGPQVGAGGGQVGNASGCTPLELPTWPP